MFTMLPGFASPHNLTWDCCCNTILSAKTPGSFTLAKSVVEIKAKKAITAIFFISVMCYV